MPIQIADTEFVAYRFSPDYLRSDKRYRKYIYDGTPPMPHCASAHTVHHIDLIIDGGNVVKCGDTIIMTEKIFHENADKSKKDIERMLRDTFHCDFLFLPWDRAEIFGHSDGVVHYAGNNRVLMTNYEDFSPSVARTIKKRLDKHFDVIPLQYHSKRKHQRSWAYINFLQVGRHIFVPQLCAEEDEQALAQISSAFPDCETLGIPALEAVRRGGGVNCITWNVKETHTNKLPT